ncbi:MAG: hypothetical protein ACTHOO_06105 [Alcanivorax sp.]
MWKHQFEWDGETLAYYRCHDHVQMRHDYVDVRCDVLIGDHETHESRCAASTQ